MSEREKKLQEALAASEELAARVAAMGVRFGAPENPEGKALRALVRAVGPHIPQALAMLAEDMERHTLKAIGATGQPELGVALLAVLLHCDTVTRACTRGAPAPRAA